MKENGILKFIDETNMPPNIVEKRLCCMVCKEHLDEDNIGAMYSEKEAVCREFSCLMTILIRENKKIDDERILYDDTNRFS